MVKFIGKWKAEYCSGCRALNQFCVTLQIGATMDSRARTHSLCADCFDQLEREVNEIREVERDLGGDAIESGPATAPIGASKR